MVALEVVIWWVAGMGVAAGATGTIWRFWGGPAYRGIRNAWRLIHETYESAKRAEYELTHRRNGDPNEHPTVVDAIDHLTTASEENLKRWDQHDFDHESVQAALKRNNDWQQREDERLNEVKESLRTEWQAFVRENEG